ncbi:MAG: DMT family transporter [Leucothrix sp.]
MRRFIFGAIPLSALFVLLWSSGLVGSKFGLGYAGTFTLLMWRYVLVVITLAALVFALRAWRPMSKTECLYHLLVGVLSHAIYLSSSLRAMDLGVSVGLVAFVLALQPMLTAVISAPLTGEKTAFHQWLGLCLGLLAVLLVVGDRLSLGGSPLAYGLLLLSTVAISIATLMNRRLEIYAQKNAALETPILMVLLIHCTGSLLCLIPLAGAIEGYQANWQPSLVFAVTFLALVVSLGAYGLMFVLMRKLPVIKVSCLLYLSPPATMIIAYFIFGERLAVVDMIGLAIAGVAVWIVSRPTLGADIELGSVNQASKA